MSTQEIVPRHRNRKKRHPLLILLSILLAMALIVAVLATVYVLHLASTLPEITIEDLETDTTRGLSAAEVAEQATCGYIRDARFTIVIGPTGTGKTFYVCALGERACRQGYKVLYFTMNTLIDQLRLVHLEGRETNFFRKLSAHDLLIIDDFGMVRLEGQIQHDFEQIIDDRYNRKALILASQLPVADWYNVFQSELIAEACLDRLVHKSKRFELKGESLRKKY